MESKAFKKGEAIALKYSAYGDGVSPPLLLKKVPGKTTSLAIICDDPDAPMPQPFVHWVIYNIPGKTRQIPEALPADSILKTPDSLKGATQGKNGLRRPGYFGPRPPKDGKIHHYSFKVYALDLAPDLEEGLNKSELMAKIEGHVIGIGELIGTYKKED